MNILDNIAITDAMVAAGTTVPEPATGETEWATGVAYKVGDLRIRKTTHRVYKCAADHTSAASPVPENDPMRWVDVGPTARWAPFDQYVNTQAKATGSITYVLTPGYFNALALYGLVGAQYHITVKDAPGGAVIFERQGFLLDDPMGWYEYLFVAQPAVTKLSFAGIPIRPGAELTVTVSAATGADVAIGMLLVGDMTPLISDAADWGGVVYGASAEPVTYSYIKTAEDGTTQIVRRHSATNMRCTVQLPRKYADQAVALLQRTLDRPLAWIATDAPRYRGLNVFGIASSAPVTYDSFQIASIDINVKGLI